MTSQLPDWKRKASEIEGQIALINVDAKPVREQLGDLDRRRAKLVGELEALRKRITEHEKAPRVSDHAVIRYLERKHGFDFEHIRSQLLTPAVRMAMDVGADAVKIDGGRLIIQGKTVVTYVG